MCDLFKEWSPQIERYCVENNFSFEKAKKLSKCWGKDDIALQFFDASKGVNGLLDETPMPLVLWIKKVGDELVFEQTEYTHKYLSI